MLEKIKTKITAAAAGGRVDKRLLPIVILGVCALAALAVSGFSDSQSAQKKEIAAESSAVDTQGYVNELESRLEKLLSSINGAGAVEVMITLESGEEQVYARDSDSSCESETDGDTSWDEKLEYLVVDDAAVKLKVIEPEIRGVAVVCEGGGSPIVKQLVVEAVTAVLGISSARVSVAQMKG